MERSSSQNHPFSPSPPAFGAVSPSSGGEFLLQLLQQGRFPSSGSKITHNSYGDVDTIRTRHLCSSTSSGADWGGSSSFNRASSLEASVSSSVFEEEQAKTHPLCRTSSAEASFLDEEQARFQLQHDPAVAAMGPSHPVGDVSAIANHIGNMSGEGRGLLPFHDRYAHPHYQQHHRHHQHLCLQQVPPPPPFDFPFPGHPPSEHVRPFPLDPLLPPVHNQFLRPYPYPPLMDHNRYLHVPPSFPHAGLLNPGRLQDTSSTLSYSPLDQLNNLSNDGLTNEHSMASMRILVPAPRSTTDVGSLSSSEQASAPPKSQFYTQFGSIGVEIPHQSGSEVKSTYAGLPNISVLRQPSSMNEHTRSLPLPLSPNGVVAQSFTSVDSSKGGMQNHSPNAEASTEVIAVSGAHAYQRRLLERFSAEGSSSMCKDGIEKLERHALPADRVSAIDTPSTQKESCVYTNISITNCITNMPSAESAHDNNAEVTARSNKPQKGLDSTRKGGNRIGVGHWVPVTKDKREEATGDNMNSVAASDGLTSKTIDDVRKRSGSNQGWRSKQLSSTSNVSTVESTDLPKRFDRLMRTKLPLQQDPVGLPSGSRVESAPSSATEQSKQALQISPDNDAVESRMQEGTADYVKPAVDSTDGANEGSAETLFRGLSVSDFDNDREEEEEPASKNKASVSEGLNLDVKESDTRFPRPIKFNRREPFHRLDSGKCTNTFLAIFQTLIPPIDEEQRRKQLLATLDELVSGIWPEARLYLFGSCANAFGVCNSDIDVCLSIEGESTPRSEVVCMLADALKANNMQNVQALTHARVPIVKYSDPKTGISCDVCVNNMLAVVNTKLLHDYAQIDVRLRQLAFIVKHWAKRRQVNETYRGTLSSYAYVLMCIHFLQQRKPPVLPCLQEMEPTYRVTVGDINCAYFDRVDELKGFGQKNKETLADLVSSFFDYWAFRHDYTRTVISIRTGKFLSKLEKDWTRRIGNERHLICIEDPFEVSHDLGRVVDKHSIRVLRDEFQRAARIMRQDANPCVALFEPYIRQKAQAA